MPRKGMNPLREKEIEYKLSPDIPVVAVITHLPNLEGYHKDRLDIVFNAVISAWNNCKTDAWFVLWDNGSCWDWTSRFPALPYDQIIFSKNIGKQNAINALCNMYHSSIIAFSDDDILHYPNWLEPQIEVLKTYPSVGLVSGCVTRHYMKYHHLYAWQWCAQNDVLIRIDDTPREWDQQHGESIGKPKNIAASMVGKVPATIIEYNNVKARIGGNHCQFVGYADTLKEFLPRTDKYMEPLYPFDIRVDDAKLLRLLTKDRLTRHLGNVLSDEDRKEIKNVI